MAATDRFMIAPLDSGIQTDVRPWLIPDDAFQELTNAYVFRGRIRKRFGAINMNSLVSGVQSQLNTRLRVNLGNTDGSGNFSGTVPGAIFDVGQMFSVGTQLFTVYHTGTPHAMKSTGTATGTFNTSTGAVVIAGAAITTALYYYPSQPVMGFVNFNNTQLDNNPLFAFDTQFAYNFVSGAWARLGTAVWTGTDSNFFWAYNWRGDTPDEVFLFVTNYNGPDRIKYWVDDPTFAWFNLSPVVNGTFRLHSARIVVPFKDRLIALNTIENDEGTSMGTTDGSGNFSGTAGAGPWVIGQNILVGSTLFTVASNVVGPQAMTPVYIPAATVFATATFDVSNGAVVITGNNTNRNLPVYYLPDSGGTETTFVNRCRYSVSGAPIAQAGNNTNANNAFVEYGGLGGYIDAPTKEQIITAQFLKDRLIVYFESSTWELVYTGNQVLPFNWQQINTELGAQSTFSEVPFDKVVLGIGSVGVHACNGSNVERIDNKIPEKVFNITYNNEGFYRVAGIRDYFSELVYWTFPSEIFNQTYPNRVLVYNYKTGSWAFFLDSFTAFGYYEQQPVVTWEDNQATWEENNEQWNSPTITPQFKQIVAGNQVGFTSLLRTETSYNESSLYITNMVNSGGTVGGILVTVTSYSHNLIVASKGSGDYILVEQAVGITGINNSIYAVNTVIDEDNFTIVVPSPTAVTGTYIGGGVISRVSNINILTKQYNFYVQDGRNAAINKVDFLFDRTPYGQITVDYMVSSSSESLLDAGATSGTLVNTGIIETSPYALYPIENTQDRLWHAIYPFAEGECIQLNLYMSAAQVMDPAISFSNFTLHAMTFYTKATSSRLQ